MALGISLILALKSDFPISPFDLPWWAWLLCAAVVGIIAVAVFAEYPCQQRERERAHEVAPRLAAKEVISQAAPTFCIQVPRFETRVATTRLEIAVGGMARAPSKTRNCPTQDCWSPLDLVSIGPLKTYTRPRAPSS